jgi:hypothetical protein
MWNGEKTRGSSFLTQIPRLLGAVDFFFFSGFSSKPVPGSRPEFSFGLVLEPIGLPRFLGATSILVGLYPTAEFTGLVGLVGLVGSADRAGIAGMEGIRGRLGMKGMVALVERPGMPSISILGLVDAALMIIAGKAGAMGAEGAEGAMGALCLAGIKSSGVRGRAPNARRMSFATDSLGVEITCSTWGFRGRGFWDCCVVGLGTLGAVVFFVTACDPLTVTV